MADKKKPGVIYQPLGRKRCKVTSYTISGGGKVTRKHFIAPPPKPLKNAASCGSDTDNQQDKHVPGPSIDQIYGAEPSYLDEPINNSGPSKRNHQSNKEHQREAWESLRENMSDVLLQSLYPQGSSCTFCHAPDGMIWCGDCGPSIFFCQPCFQEHHPMPHLHKPLICQNDMILPYQFTQPPWKRQGHDCPNHRIPKSVCVVDDRGRQHEIQVEICVCEPEAVTLLRHHIWPASPTSPAVGFTFQLMDWICIMQLECHVSLDKFTTALQNRNGDRLAAVNQIFVRNIYRTLLGGCVDEYRFLKTQSLCPEQDDGVKCPACPTSEDPGPVYLSLDANFGLCRKRSSGKASGPPRHEGHSVLCPQEEVDSFIQMYDDSASLKEECHDFDAGSRVRSSMKSNKLDETGVFGVACSHGFLKSFLSLKHGERLGYAVYILDRVMNSMGNQKLYVLYDIACRLEAHLKAGGQLSLLNKMKLAIPIFHNFGHGRKCQVLYGPRRVEGMGLVDGEVMERLWSYLRGFNKMTKEMSPEHRQDILVDAILYHSWKLRGRLGNGLVQKMKNAEKMQSKAETDLSRTAEDTLTKIKRSVQERHYLANLQKSYPDGQQVSIRLQRQRKNEDVKLEKLISKYNSEEGQENPISLGDVKSGKWMPEILSQSVPQDAIKAWCLLQRCYEEKANIKEEMKRTFLFHVGKLNTLYSKVDALIAPLSMQKQRALLLERFVLELHSRFSTYVELPVIQTPLLDSLEIQISKDSNIFTDDVEDLTAADSSDDDQDENEDHD